MMNESSGHGDLEMVGAEADGPALAAEVRPPGTCEVRRLCRGRTCGQTGAAAPGQRHSLASRPGRPGTCTCCARWNIQQQLVLIRAGTDSAKKKIFKILSTLGFNNTNNNN